MKPLPGSAGPRCRFVQALVANLIIVKMGVVKFAYYYDSSTPTPICQSQKGMLAADCPVARARCLKARSRCHSATVFKLATSRLIEQRPAELNHHSTMDAAAAGGCISEPHRDIDHDDATAPASRMAAHMCGGV